MVVRICVALNLHSRYTITLVDVNLSFVVYKKLTQFVGMQIHDDMKRCIYAETWQLQIRLTGHLQIPN